MNRSVTLPTRYKTVQPKLDDKKRIHHPLDYSFKTISTFEDLLKEKKRERQSSSAVVLDLDEEVEEVEVVQSNTTALKVNNNLLVHWDGFTDVIQRLFVDPALTLAWIDLSFNDIRTIDESLTELPNLTMLYLHGNNIYSVSQIDKLVCLAKLKSLALHGNPMEVAVGYRQYVVCVLPQLQTFDFSCITKVERTTAESWIRMNAKKPKSKKTS